MALAFGIAANCTAAVAGAGTDRPVYVTVVGHGAIRFRLAVGPMSPCDSPDNRMLYDGWLQPGRYEWSTGAGLVCFQNTSGAFRESDWSESRIVPTWIRRRGATQIVVSTD
jgi:hypothetical protein